jgi:lipopolysaccharide/colanic/teichoic acid biosynthesis glycosyltransferase
MKVIDNILKRLFDIIFSLFGLLVLLPLFIYIIVRIKLDSKGPIFYRGRRIGKFGKPFRIYKFRTMYADADKMRGGPSAGDDDPRITKFGRSIRSYKLNELPQLINVLKGEMSFVGPRPEVEQYVEIYTEEEKAILSVRPGITDYASIKFHNEGEILSGSPDPDRTYEEVIRPEKLRLQLEYVRNHSLWVDFKLLFMTLGTLIKMKSELQPQITQDSHRSIL